MKDTSKLKNYREKYKRYYGVEFGKEYAVHHIDQDRENNDITNLVMLPRKLHSRYHFLKAIVEEMPCVTHIGEYQCFAMYQETIEAFADCLRECEKWYEYKMELEWRRYQNEIHD